MLTLVISLSAKQRQNSCSGPPPVYQDLSTCHNWHVENPLVICQSQWKQIQNALLVICLVHWWPRTSIIGSALQMLLTEVKLHRSATKATCYTACILTNYAPLIMPPGAVLHLFSGVLLRQVFSCCQWSLYQVSSSQEPAQRLFRLKLLAIHQEYLLYVSHFHYQFQLQEL